MVLLAVKKPGEWFGVTTRCTCCLQEVVVHQVLRLHLDLEFLSFDESAVRGALPEMWGLQPMTEKTKELLDQKSADN